MFSTNARFKQRFQNSAAFFSCFSRGWSSDPCVSGRVPPTQRRSPRPQHIRTARSRAVAVSKRRIRTDAGRDPVAESNKTVGAGLRRFYFTKVL